MPRTPLVRLRVSRSCTLSASTLASCGGSPVRRLAWMHFQEADTRLVLSLSTPCWDLPAKRCCC